MGDEYTVSELKMEWLKAAELPVYFFEKYVRIYDATSSAWIDFSPVWPSQSDVVDRITDNNQVIILKARQLGLSWVSLAYALWLMIFHPAATILLISMRDDEATELLGRLKGMYDLLPEWIQCKAIDTSNTHNFVLSNGSKARALTASAGGRSLTGTLVIIDEADFITQPDLSQVLNSCKPSIDAGGKLIIISTPDRSRPTSTFKKLFRASLSGDNSYIPIFLSWRSRPGRTQEWYERIARDMISQQGTTDDLWQEYPETVAQALSPISLDKRFRYDWIEKCFRDNAAILDTRFFMANLRVYEEPIHGRTYVIGGDPAEGNPNSDDSVATVMDATTWEEVACLSGKIEPGDFGQRLIELAEYYNSAGVMVERNNHGHAVLLRMADSPTTYILNGHDDRPGWATNVKSKTLMCDLAAEVLRDQETSIRTTETRLQLADLEATTLRAPEGLHDDFAMSIMLGLMGCKWVQSSALIFYPYMQPPVSLDKNATGRHTNTVWSIYDAYMPGREDDYLRAIIVAREVLGKIHIIDADYATGISCNEHIQQMLKKHPDPEYVVVPPTSIEIRQSAIQNELYVRQGYPRQQDALRIGRREIARVVVDSGCEKLLLDLSRWRYVPGRDVPSQAGEHGPTALLHLLWNLRERDNDAILQATIDSVVPERQGKQDSSHATHPPFG